MRPVLGGNIPGGAVSELPPRTPAITPAQRQEALRQVNRRSLQTNLLWEWIKVFQIAVVLFFGVRAFFIEAFKIPSGSMEQTLLVGDFLLVNKLIYGAEIPFTGRHLPRIRAPQLGDVIVFQYPLDHSKNYVKRLVGLPGDTLAMADGILVRNGTPVGERYVMRSEPGFDPSDDGFRWQRNYIVQQAEASRRYRPSRNNWGPLIVPERNYFVLGDNRDNSLDSRYWGFVPDSLVRGRPLFVYYSYAPDTAEGFSWLTRIRWDRLGERVN
jgi:signal peptidase I